MSISINKEQNLYIIPCGDGFTCLGFDVAFDKTRAIASELNRRDLVPSESYRGTLEGYLEYSLAIDAARASGKRLECELTPQLKGLEGKRVEIMDKYGDKRRFIVGRSTGFIPCHLEIKTRRSSGGEAVYGAPFTSVRVVKP